MKLPIVALALTLSGGALAQEEVSEAEGSPLRRSNRMDFDARLVQGEGAQSGAVYLFQRAPRPLPGLVSLRQSYLDRIVLPVLGPEAAEGVEKEQ